MIVVVVVVVLAVIVLVVVFVVYRDALRSFRVTASAAPSRIDFLHEQRAPRSDPSFPTVTPSNHGGLGSFVFDHSYN